MKIGNPGNEKLAAKTVSHSENSHSTALLAVVTDSGSDKLIESPLTKPKQPKKLETIANPEARESIGLKI